MTSIVVIKKRILVKVKKIIVRMKGSIVMKENIASINGKISQTDISKVRMKKFADPNFTALFDDAEKVKAACEKALGSKGVAYCLTNKEKQCICLYTFDKIIDPDDKKRFRLVKNYNFTAKGYEVKEDAFVEYLKAQIQEMIVFTGVNSVDWNGEITTAKDVEDSGFAPYGMTASSFFTFSIVFFICFKDNTMNVIGFVFMILGFITLCSGAAIRIGKDKVNIGGNEDDEKKEDMQL